MLCVWKKLYMSRPDLINRRLLTEVRPTGTWYVYSMIAVICIGFRPLIDWSFDRRKKSALVTPQASCCDSIQMVWTWWDVRHRGRGDVGAKWECETMVHISHLGQRICISDEVSQFSTVPADYLFSFVFAGIILVSRSNQWRHVTPMLGKASRRLYTFIP